MPFAHEPAEHPDRRPAQVADGPHPEPSEGLGRLLAHAPQRPHGQRVQVGVDLAGPNHHHAVGLGVARGELGDQLGGRHAHRAPHADAVLDLPADLAPDLLGLAEQQVRARDVEERLVERDRFDLGGDRQQDLAEAVGVHLVGLEVGRDEDHVRTQATSAHGGHRAPDPERPRLVGRRHHDPARPGAAHGDGLARKARVLERLDRGVERIEIDVQDRLARPRAGHRRGAYRRAGG